MVTYTLTTNNKTKQKYMMEKTLFIHLYTAFNFNNESVWVINV